MPAQLVVKAAKGRNCAKPKGQVVVVSVWKAGRAWAEVYGGGCKDAGGEVGLEATVICKQFAHGFSIVPIEVGEPRAKNVCINQQPAAMLGVGLLEEKVATLWRNLCLISASRPSELIALCLRLPGAFWPPP